MNKKVVMIDVNADSRTIRELLGQYKHSVFPLVDNHQSRILIGAITRSELSKSLEMSLDRPLECARQIGTYFSKVVTTPIQRSPLNIRFKFFLQNF